MTTIFERVILYARHHRANQHVHESLERLLAFLQTLPLEVGLDPETKDSFILDAPIVPHKDLGKKRDLIVVVGGDGSLLSAARLSIEVHVPVIGINRGRLGFLTDISPTDIEAGLSAILQGQYKEEQRFLLQTSIVEDNITYFKGNALNDIVLGRGNETHLIEFDVYIDQQFVSHYRSDGIIISTPTGSTAYALSAGGPIMHPALNAIVLVPMFSHSLRSRTIVVDAEAHITLVMSVKNETDLRVSCDGHESRLAKPGQKVHIQKEPRKLRLLHPTNYHYYDTLRKKLGWESNV